MGRACGCGTGSAAPPPICAACALCAMSAAPLPAAGPTAWSTTGCREAGAGAGDGGSKTSSCRFQWARPPQSATATCVKERSPGSRATYLHAEKKGLQLPVVVVRVDVDPSFAPQLKHVDGTALAYPRRAPPKNHHGWHLGWVSDRQRHLHLNHLRITAAAARLLGVRGLVVCEVHHKLPVRAVLCPLQADSWYSAGLERLELCLDYWGHR